MDWLLDRFAQAPERAAFIHRDRRVTYAMVIDRTVTFREWIAVASVERGDRVAVVGTIRRRCSA